ncbi:hypothetical protein [Legionella sp. MW5194]|nr:hypothetical protein [Legionella sp. MW5194]
MTDDTHQHAPYYESVVCTRSVLRIGVLKELVCDVSQTAEQ